MKWTAQQLEFPDGPRWRVEAGGHVFDVEVPAGNQRLQRLERAVHAKMGLPARVAPVPPRYRVDKHVHSAGGPFELEETTTWTVYDDKTGSAVLQFSAESSASWSGGGSWAGGGSSGVDEVVLGADGLGVLSRNSDKVASHPLPRIQA